MSQTIEGAKKTGATNKRKYGDDYYAKIGALGGKKGKGHKFAHGKVDPSVAGAKGGAISKRGKSIDYELNFEDIHTKAETKKRVYSPSNTRVDSNSVSSPISKLSSAFNRVVRK